MNEPIVSICCQTYNHKNFIVQALESFLMQKTNFKFEILLRDDASTDGTAEICKKYAEKYPEIINPLIYSENQYQKGISPFQDNVKRAQGKYIAMCEGDDYWIDPLKLQKQVDFLEANPEYVLCSHDVKLFYQNSGTSSTWSFKKTDYNAIDCLAGTVSHPNTWVFRNGNTIPPGVFYLPMGDDPIIFHLLQQRKAKHFKEEMSVYRISEVGTWSTLNSLGIKFRMFIFHLWVIKFYKKYFLKQFLTLNNDVYIISKIYLIDSLSCKKQFNSKKLPWEMLWKNLSVGFIFILLFEPPYAIYKLFSSLFKHFFHTNINFILKPFTK